MTDALATYLQDHLAGSHFAVELLNSLHDQYRSEALGKFASALLAEIKQDQETLQGIIGPIGKGHFDLKEAVGWLAEKATQFKLRRDDSGSGLGTFEVLETLTLGIRGKLALWQALPVIREIDPRIPDLDFGELAARAEGQYAQAEQQRLKLARVTFRPVPE